MAHIKVNSTNEITCQPFDTVNMHDLREPMFEKRTIGTLNYMLTSSTRLVRGALTIIETQ
jgi:hypothetical protein